MSYPKPLRFLLSLVLLAAGMGPVAASTAPEPGKANLAVLPHPFEETRENLNPLGDAFVKALTTSFETTRRFQPVAFDRVQKQMRKLGETGIKTAESALVAGKHLGVQFVCYGTLTVKPDHIRMDSYIIDTVNDRIEWTASTDWYGITKPLMDKGAAYHLKRLLEVPITSGTVILHPEPAGATLWLNHRKVQAGERIRLDGGAAALIETKARGFQSSKRIFLVKPGEVSQLYLSLRPERNSSRSSRGRQKEETSPQVKRRPRVH